MPMFLILSHRWIHVSTGRSAEEVFPTWIGVLIRALSGFVTRQVQDLIYLSKMYHIRHRLVTLPTNLPGQADILLSISTSAVLQTFYSGQQNVKLKSEAWIMLRLM